MKGKGENGQPGIRRRRWTVYPKAGYTKTFYPKPGYKYGGWQVFWLVSAKCAFPGNQVAQWLKCTSRLSGKTGRETYSSGYCPGFAPVFPFHPGTTCRETNYQQQR